MAEEVDDLDGFLDDGFLQEGEYIMDDEGSPRLDEPFHSLLPHTVTTPLGFEWALGETLEEPTLIMSLEALGPLLQEIHPSTRTPPPPPLET